jgi:excisionase family DNA binding protein
LHHPGLKVFHGGAFLFLFEPIVTNITAAHCLPYKINGGFSMSEHAITDKFAFSIEELAMLTTLSAPKIRKDIRTGKLKSLKKGSRRLILKDEAIRYINVDDADRPEEK